MENKIGNKFLYKNSETTYEDSVKQANMVGLYFSALWCPPCRSFTPTLNNFYSNVNENEKQIEIIFIPFDKSEEEFIEYYKLMPWLAIPYDDPRIKAIKSAFNITSIPMLVILRKDGNLITVHGRSDITSAGDEAINKWIDLSSV